MSSLSFITEGGFCNEDFTIHDAFGENDWPETVVGVTSELNCSFSGDSVNPVARRTCGPGGVWQNIDYNQCNTFITMMYQEFNAVCPIVPSYHHYSEN